MAKGTPETPAQDAVMEFVRDYKTSEHYDSDGNSPTYEEIANHLGVRPATAYGIVLKLIKRGKLRVNGRGKIVLGGKYLPPE